MDTSFIKEYILPLDKIWDIIGQVDDKVILEYIYNPNTEEENRSILNKAKLKN